jgi:hypothetical protein
MPPALPPIVASRDPALRPPIMPAGGKASAPHFPGRDPPAIATGVAAILPALLCLLPPLLTLFLAEFLPRILALFLPALLPFIPTPLLPTLLSALLRPLALACPLPLLRLLPLHALPLLGPLAPLDALARLPALHGAALWCDPPRRSPPLWCSTSRHGPTLRCSTPGRGPARLHCARGGPRCRTPHATTATCAAVSAATILCADVRRGYGERVFVVLGDRGRGRTGRCQQHDGCKRYQHLHHGRHPAISLTNEKMLAGVRVPRAGLLT